MAPRIRILPEQLTNKIAAGEVVERPASVVKELAENSIDAQATEIIVEIENGGRRLIRVADNGCGMSRDDLLISLERHATSKISTDADLFTLSSLGFRGEAIPSIASVSRFSLASRESGSIEGAEVYAEGGRIVDVKSCGMPAGTVVTVRNLFFNTPARLKFMKSRETETGHVGEIINRLALSRPDIRFIYSVDGKPVYRLPAGDLPARARELFGSELAKELYQLDASMGGIALQGLLGTPAASRSTTGCMYTYINGRYVRDKVVQHAIMQGYRNVLERGRYPVLVLFIELAPGDVDVNVHPTKHEVRFREQAAVHAAIQSAVEEHLHAAAWLKGSGALSVRAPAQPLQSPHAARVAEVKEALLRYAAVQQPAAAGPFPAAGSSPPLDLPAALPQPVTPSVTAGTAEEGFSALRIIGQFRSAYILCQDEADLLIIDQHAAHERVVFEQLRASFRAGRVDGQRLLFPETVALSPLESETLKVHAATLQKMAFELEEFGQNTWLLTAIPLQLASQNYRQSLLDILAELSGLGASSLFAEKCDELLAKVACHSSVRGEWHLSTTEIEGLLKRMDQTGFAANCPHGRPVIARITLKEIEKMFRRS
ncbi:MAG: mismatch repair protein MutL [Deltaproteobacteria bacterium]|nr:mismatch repair protein MutL [Deltaproteobacteria bacterium]